MVKFYRFGYVKYFEMRGLSWIIWVDHKCHQKCYYAREAKEFDTHRRGVSVTMVTEIGLRWPQDKECKQAPETVRGEE